jgi:wyosine [tRNA(Phe)-imidazoG37] synthetase (radical SAM superfamily)
VSEIIFGPVTSRRFGISLGVDLSPEGKQCNYDCLYCELDKARPVTQMQSVVPVDAVINALSKALAQYPQAQYITLTANGEPTLYPHLKTLISAIRALHVTQQILILSNGSTIMQPAIQEALLEIDVVKLSLDCATQRCFCKLDRPAKGVDIEAIIEGMKAFSKRFARTLILEVLVVKGVNDTKETFVALNEAIQAINPCRVDVGTIARPPAYNVQGVDVPTLHELAALIEHVPVAVPLGAHYTARYDFGEETLLALLKKRPQNSEDVKKSFSDASKKCLERLLKNGTVHQENVAGMMFYTTP